MSSHHKLKRDCTPEEWRIYSDRMRPYVQRWKSTHIERVKELERAWRESHPERMRVITRRATEKLKRSDPEYKSKIACRNKLNGEVRSGRLVKPEACSSCFAVGLITAHHEDYTRPLRVVWLCSSCHKRLHQERKRGQK